MTTIIISINFKDVILRWAMGNAFYVLEFTVSDGPPKINHEAANKM